MTQLDFNLIQAQLPVNAGRLIVAYSGGVDSHVLLHLCASQIDWRERILAVYVDHGLQAISGAWAEHCREQAAQLTVAYQCLRVDARAAIGISPEAAAREARYRALRDLMLTDDVLLLAQHRDDQMETVLLQLFRGAGVRGLAAMPARQIFGGGIMLRPLLDVTRRQIVDYAVQHELQWVEDPSNQTSDFDRNFLRNQVLPLLRQRWPSLDKTVARTARHCGEADRLLRQWQASQLDDLLGATGDCLLLDNLLTHASDQRQLLLREWLMRLGLRPPSTALLRAIETQLIAARDDADPKIQIQGRWLRKYRRQLFCLPDAATQSALACTWSLEAGLLQLSNGYRLRAIEVDHGGICRRLWNTSRIEIKPRTGGERLKMSGRAGHHPLKNLYQEFGIPPWERQSRPLIYLNGRLAAVAGLWVDEWACNPEQDAGYRLVWEYADDVVSLSVKEVADVYGP